MSDGKVSLEDGSSPLTRGKRGFLPLICAACGLIPAHAGKPGPDRLVIVDTRAHPRSRGENPVHG